MAKHAHIGSAIRQLRLKRGFTLQTLGEMSGLHKSILSRLESGLREPRMKHLEKVAEAFEISVGELMRKYEGKK